MWAEFWGLTVEPDLNPACQVLLRDYLSAWRADELLVAGSIAHVGRLGVDETRSVLQRDAGLFQVLQGLPIAGQSAQATQLAPDTWALRQGDSACVLTQHAAAAPEVRVGGPGGSDLLFIALSDLFRANGWMTVHASAVVLPSGRLRVSLGRSGAGKSVRAMHAVGGEGCQFVGEDRIWLHTADRMVVARDRRARLLPAGAAAVASLPVAQAAMDPDGKLRFPLELLGLEPAQPAPLDELEVLMGQHAEDPLSDLSPEKRSASRRLIVLQALWESMGLPFLPQAQKNTAAAVQSLLSLDVNVLRRCALNHYHEV